MVIGFNYNLYLLLYFWITDLLLLLLISGFSYVLTKFLSFQNINYLYINYLPHILSHFILTFINIKLINLIINK